MQKLSRKNNDIFKIAESFINLEYLPRTGFAMSKIENAQSVAEHSFGVCLWALILMDRMKNIKIDKAKVLTMAIIHETAETILGDIPYPARMIIDKPVISQAERKTVSNLFNSFPNWKSDWEEFEASDTLESKIVRAADKLEMMHRVLCYEKTGKILSEEFWNTSANFYNGELPEAKKLYDEIVKKHNELMKK